MIRLAVFCDQRNIDLEWINENLATLKKLSTDALYLYGNASSAARVA